MHPTNHGDLPGTGWLYGDHLIVDNSATVAGSAGRRPVGPTAAAAGCGGYVRLRLAAGIASNLTGAGSRTRDDQAHRKGGN